MPPINPRYPEMRPGTVQASTSNLSQLPVKESNVMGKEITPKCPEMPHLGPTRPFAASSHAEVASGRCTGRSCSWRRSRTTGRTRWRRRRRGSASVRRTASTRSTPMEEAGRAADAPLPEGTAGEDRPGNRTAGDHRHRRAARGQRRDRGHQAKYSDRILCKMAEAHIPRYKRGEAGRPRRTTR